MKGVLAGRDEFFVLEITDMSESHLHLKICEGCGRLWLRNVETFGVYCQRCTLHLAQFPAPRGRRRTGRSHKMNRTCGQQEKASNGGNL